MASPLLSEKKKKKKTIHDLEETKAIPSAGKIVGFFWDSQVVVMIEYLNHGATITETLYAGQMTKLREEIRKQPRGKR